ncbi:MAG: GAF domain-containing protein [Anaerolineales bacterium]
MSGRKEQLSRQRLWSRVALFLLVLVLAWPGGIGAQPQEQRILVLNSYHHGLSWTDNIVRGLLELLEPDLDYREIYLEYMDTKRFASTPEYFEELARVYREKYAEVDLDVIVVADNDAFNFIRDYHDTLFPGVPVIFCGVNFFDHSMLAGMEDTITGVAEEPDIAATFDLMLELHPQAERIVVVNDATTTGVGYSESLHKVAADFEERIDFWFYEGLTTGELIGRLEDLPDNSLIYLVLFNRDAAGRFFTYQEAVELVYSTTSAPIYSTWDFYMDRGMVGGKLTNGFSQGAAAGQLTLELLDGASVSELPVVRSPNRYIFDYRQLQRLGIDLGALPPGSEIRNRPLSFIERYRQVLWPAVAVLVGLSAVIGVQVVNLARRRAVERELRVTNVELNEARAGLEERVAERTRDLERRTQELEIAATVARDAAGLYDLEELLTTAVELISERFGFYHAGIFLADESGQEAALAAASSEGGRRMLARGHRLPRGQGIVGYVLKVGKPRIALDVGGDAVWFDNPDLRETRSELGLPLIVRDQVIGVLDVQSVEAEAFSEEELSMLQTLADQLALAIANARLFQESEQTLRELQRLYGEESREAWEKRVAREPVVYHYTGVGVERASLAEGGDGADEETDGHRLLAEIPLRDQMLASIALIRDAGASPWSQEERALVEAITTQAGLALENARLLEETRSRAARERLIGDITSQIRAEVEVQAVLERALAELGEVLDVRRAVVELEVEE